MIITLNKYIWILNKIKINALTNYDNIIVKDEQIYYQIVQSIQNIGFRSIDDFELYLKFEEYEFDEFKEKILLELKWNQLVYQFYKNQIIIDKKKIDKKLKTLIAEQKINEEYLLYEIFIENSAIKELNKESEEESKKNNVVEELTENKAVDGENGIKFEVESASYNNNKNLIDEKKSIFNKLSNLYENNFDADINKFCSPSCVGIPAAEPDM